jgi:ketosteroid isomerase-like protein
MTTPDAATIRRAIEGHVGLLNAGDKRAWLALWDEMAPGGVTALEDPVGTPVKSGPDVLNDVWERSAKSGVERVKATIKQLTVNADTAAVVVENVVKRSGRILAIDSIEIWRFLDDGSLDVRTFWNPPTADSDLADPGLGVADESA